MKAYKLNIEVIIAAVGIFTILVFSLVLIIFGGSTMHDVTVTEYWIDYGYIIAPTSLLWILTNKFLWHTRPFQAIRKSANIPPDLRGRWEGILENEDGSATQKFVIEIKQTLTTLNVFSYSSLGRSVSILPEIASSENEDAFSLCFLWQGETNTSIKDIHHREHFNGYTILNLHEHEHPKTLKGFYFTNKLPSQTRGGIELSWVSKTLKRTLE
jgi:hypothetical protein